MNDGSAENSQPVTLQKLSQKHKDVLALLAQGVGRTEIASVCGFTPEYVTWLAKQPVCKPFLEELKGFVDFRLVALTERSVDVIAETMNIGSQEDKLKAAKLQLEATGRLGRDRGQPVGESTAGRLESLAERLVGLLENKRKGVTYDGQSTEVVEAG